MQHRVRVPVRNGGTSDLVVVVEPWGSEMRLAPGQEGVVILAGADRPPTHSVEVCAYGLIFWADDMMTDFELWRGGERLQ